MLLITTKTPKFVKLSYNIPTHRMLLNYQKGIKCIKTNLSYVYFLPIMLTCVFDEGYSFNPARQGHKEYYLITTCTCRCNCKHHFTH